MKKLLLILALGACAFAQSDQARLVGTITDSSGGVIPNANITITEIKTNAKREAKADGKGYYLVTNLPPSLYTVTAGAANFSTAEVKDYHLSAGQERTLNLTLTPGTVASEITVVSGELSEVETSSAAIGTNVNAREVGTLPLNGRQLSQLYLLTPGAQTAGGGSFDNIRFSGRANQQNAIRFDGIEGSAIIDASPGNLNGETSTGFRLNSSLETVAEFRVDSSNYPAEFGTGTGGQISVVTKTGGNSFHGGLFEYIRNNSLDARNFFDGAFGKTPLRLNQFGGSLGGPLLKDKAFFFAAFEALRQRAAQNVLGSVPNAVARAAAVPSIAALVRSYPVGIPVPSVNPALPGLDIAQRLISSTVDETYGSLRFDYRFNDRLSSYVRYNRDQGYAQSPLDVSGAYQLITSTPQNAVLGFQQILAPTIINETKFGFNASKTRVSGFAPAIPGVDTSAFAVSFTGSVANPGIGGQGGSQGASTLGNLIRSNSTQNGRGQPYTTYTLSFIDSLNVIKQKHSLKFGFEFRPVRIYTDRLGGTTYTFSNLAGLLANTPTQIQVLGDTSSPDPFNNGATGNRFMKQFYTSMYAQDEWKIRPNFTMSYGLRYEYYQPMHEDRNLFVLFNANTGQLACGNAAVCQNPNTTAWYKSSKLNLGPRLAFSWSPERFKNKTVFRIGGGYYYGPGQTEDQVQPIDSDRASRSITSGALLAFPVIPSQILSGFDVTNLSGFQPRAYPPDEYKLPEKILSYTASVQQSLPGSAVLTVAYVGSQGRNLFLRSWTNRIIGVTQNAATGAGAAQLQYGSRFAQIDYKTSGGTDNYNSLQTTLNRRFAKGLTAGLQWTYAHSIGNTGGSNEAQTTQNPFDFTQDHGNNAFDVRHSMNASVLYALPVKFKSSAMNRVAGGWEVGGIFNARTGLPIDVTMGRNDLLYRVNSTGQIINNPYCTLAGAPVLCSSTATGRVVQTTAIINNPSGGAFRNNRRPTVVAGVDPFLSTGDRRFILNPAAFTTPAPGAFGNLGRFPLHGPGLSQLDFTLHKRFDLTERYNLEFRAELYNLLNRANFSNPPGVLPNGLPSVSTTTGAIGSGIQPGQAMNASSGLGSFGVVQGTVSKDVGLGAQRQVQFSLRLNF